MIAADGQRFRHHASAWPGLRISASVRKRFEPVRKYGLIRLDNLVYSGR